jgi:3-polyprenyl-4-hydroxybenzoate decarboxylase
VSSYVPGCTGKTSGDGDACYAANPTMTIVATNVNKSSVNSSYWNTTKSLTARMDASPVSTTSGSSIPIVVVPCAVSTIAAIAKV